MKLKGPRISLGGLTAAELARSILAAASGLRLGVLNQGHDVHRHAVAADGSLVFCPPLGTAEPPPALVTMTVTDVVGVPMADRVRGRVTLTGRLCELTEQLPPAVVAHVRGLEVGEKPAAVVREQPIVVFSPTRVSLQWSCESEESSVPQTAVTPVDLGSYRKAAPDPMFVASDDWLGHLHAGHAATLRLLAETETGPLPDRVDVRPLLVDRAGLVLRLLEPEGRRDVRISFTEPVRCGCQLREQLNAFLDQVDPNGDHPACEG